MKYKIGLYSGIFAIQLGCGTSNEDSLVRISMLLDSTYDINSFTISVYKAHLSAQAVDLLHFDSTIFAYEQPTSRTQVFVGDILIYPGVVQPPIPNLPLDTAIELQVLTPITSLPNNYLSYVLLRKAP